MIMTGEIIRKIVKITRFTDACPTQWDALDDQDRRYYIRYRFGRLTAIEVQNRDDWAEHLAADKSGILATKIVNLEHGDRLDGHMEDAQMFALCSEQFNFDDVWDWDHVDS